jgi:hypothetical protein
VPVVNVVIEFCFLVYVNVSMVFISLPLVVKYIGFITVSVGLKEWQCCRRCSANLGFVWPSVISVVLMKLGGK